MPRQLSQPEPEQQEQKEQQEVAYRALRMAGFNIGDIVVAPSGYSEGVWQIHEVDTFEVYGRKVPAVKLRERSSGNLVVMTVQDLCIANPEPEFLAQEERRVHGTPYKEIPTDLTENRIIELKKNEVNGRTTKIVGRLMNPPIKIGNSIVLSSNASTSPVTSILNVDGIFRICVLKGSIYEFDLSRSIRIQPSED
jgi:hypothetical protein